MPRYEERTMSPLQKPDNGGLDEFASRAKGLRDRAQFRPSAEQKELFVRAAALTGQSLSEFMRTAVEERAKRVIEEHERIVLTERGRKTFLDALTNPPRPNDRLAALAERYAREVKSRS
ncbi:MAG TPA: DUF1778 domain-containing protein [Candidatus Elarobacter sp.]